MTTIVGVSLKMYFSHARTLDYCAALADLATGSAPVVAGRTRLVVMPQYPSIPAALQTVAGSRVEVGAQDVATDDQGAFTGEVSGAVLAEIGCRHVEVGHAERRRLFGDTDQVVAAKTQAALRNGLAPWLCIGEPDRTEPSRAARDCIEQVRSAVGSSAGGPAASPAGQVIVAYEPHWAIGAPQPAPTDYVIEVCEAIRGGLRDSLDDFAIVYGGSAGPGLLTELGTAVDGIFLGRFAHDPAAVGDVLAETADRPTLD